MESDEIDGSTVSARRPLFDPDATVGSAFGDAADLDGEGWGDGGAFEATVRRYYQEADPPPEEYRSFVRLAYQFRDLAVAEVDTGDELVGVRSGNGAGSHRTICQARYGDEKLLWRIEGAQLVGSILPARSVLIRIEGLGSPIGETRTDEFGSFSFDGRIGLPYRLIVETDDQVWATTWHS